MDFNVFVPYQVADGPQGIRCMTCVNFKFAFIAMAYFVSQSMLWDMYYISVRAGEFLYRV